MDYISLKIIINKFIDEHSNNYSSLLKSKKYKELYDAVLYYTPLLDDKFYTISTHLYWILNDLTDFPVCKHCGKKMTYKNVLSAKNGYRPFCSVKCMRNSKEYLDSYTKTCNEKYGVPSSNSSQEVKNNKELSIYNKYGVFNISQLPENKLKIGETWNLKPEEELKNIKNKKNNTKHSHYTDEEISQISRDAYNNRSAECKKNAIEKQRNSYYNKSDEEKQARINKILYTKSLYSDERKEEILEKSRQTSIKHFGVPNVSQSDYFKKIRRKRYKYNNEKFDSSWELAYYIYCIDNKIEIECEPISFEYTFEGKVHKYFPDFRINGTQLVEIKGDQFFEEGLFINPFDRSQDELYQVKWNCMMENNVQVLTSKDITPFLDYVTSIYGKDYLSSFLIEETEDIL